MDAFPAFFALAGRTIVIAGKGEGAEAKARLFETSPARLVRLEGAAALVSENYRGCLMAFIGDEDEAYCVAAATAARQAGALVNVVDRPAHSDFSTPAIVDRGAIVAAVGTAGAAPILASMLRGELETRIPATLGRLATWLNEVRDEIRRARPDLAQRRAFLRDVITGPIGEAAMEGNIESAQRQLAAALGATAQRAGRLYLLDGSIDADLLSQRALRILGEADAVVVDDGASTEIVARARRDATRLLRMDEVLSRLATGERIVHIMAGPPLPLSGAEILPVARF